MPLRDDMADRRCKMARVIEHDFEPEEFDVLDKWLDRGYGPVRLHRGFKVGGHNVSQSAITAHLSGTCMCDPEAKHPYWGINAP